MLQLIDRRPNGRGKSAVNRERFLRRYKAQIQEAVRGMIGERRISDMERGGEVRVPKKDISEPSFDFGHGGDREFVLPGNREFVVGDRIARPNGAGGAGGGTEGGTGDGEDDFVFSLSREEFMQIFFDDLELPNLARTEFGQRRPVPERACRVHEKRCADDARGDPHAVAVARPPDRDRRWTDARDGRGRRSLRARRRRRAGRTGGAAPRRVRAPSTASRRAAVPRGARPALPQSRASARTGRHGRRCSA